MWEVCEAGDTGPLTWRPSGVREHPGTETGMARNLLEAVRMLRQRGKEGWETQEPETKGLDHLSTVVPSDWLTQAQVPLPYEGSALGPAGGDSRSRSPGRGLGLPGSWHRCGEQ